MKNKATTIAIGIVSLALIYIAATIVFSSDGSKEIEEARESNDIVLVDFWAEGCHPCVMIAPYIAEIKEEYPTVMVLSVDINSEDNLHKNYEITHVPTVIIFYKGKEFARLVGYHEKEEYTMYIESLLYPDESIMMEFEWK